jgi:hypothetical protein
MSQPFRPHCRARLGAHTRVLTRLVVLWLIALVLPLQGAGVGALGALGAAHVHQRSATALVLEDVRRWKPASPARSQTHAPSWFGHAHAEAAPKRHHHALSDQSVVRSDHDPADADEAAGSGALSVLAMIPATPAWLDVGGAAAVRATPSWRPRSGFTRHPERPPKFG